MQEQKRAWEAWAGRGGPCKGCPACRKLLGGPTSGARRACGLRAPWRPAPPPQRPQRASAPFPERPYAGSGPHGGGAGDTHRRPTLPAPAHPKPRSRLPSPPVTPVPCTTTLPSNHAGSLQQGGCGPAPHHRGPPGASRIGGAAPLPGPLGTGCVRGGAGRPPTQAPGGWRQVCNRGRCLPLPALPLLQARQSSRMVVSAYKVTLKTPSGEQVGRWRGLGAGRPMQRPGPTSPTAKPACSASHSRHSPRRRAGD